MSWGCRCGYDMPLSSSSSDRRWLWKRRRTTCFCNWILSCRCKCHISGTAWHLSTSDGPDSTTNLLNAGPFHSYQLRCNCCACIPLISIHCGVNLCVTAEDWRQNTNTNTVARFVFISSETLVIEIICKSKAENLF